MTKYEQQVKPAIKFHSGGLTLKANYFVLRKAKKRVYSLLSMIYK